MHFRYVSIDVDHGMTVSSTIFVFASWPLRPADIALWLSITVSAGLGQRPHLFRSLAMRLWLVDSPKRCSAVRKSHTLAVRAKNMAGTCPAGCNYAERERSRAVSMMLSVRSATVAALCIRHQSIHWLSGSMRVYAAYVWLQPT